MAVKYVDNVNGSDGAAGTEFAPYATIDFGCQQAGASGTVHVKDAGSSYDGRDNIGTLPILARATGQTIQGYIPSSGGPQHIPTLSGTPPNDATQSVLDTNQFANITFSHFNIPAGGVNVAGGPTGVGGCVVEYITASRGSAGSGNPNPCTIALDSNNVNLASGNIVRYCTITGAPDGAGGATNPENCRAIFVDHQTQILIHNNTFLAGATGQGGVGIKHVANNFTLRHNFLDRFNSYGFQMTMEAGTLNTFSIHHNVFECPNAIHSGCINPATSQASSDWEFYNNTIYGQFPFRPALAVLPTGYWRFYNNIVEVLNQSTHFYQDYSTAALSGLGTITIDYNMYERTSGGNNPTPDANGLWQENSARKAFATWQTLTGTPDVGGTVTVSPSLTNVGGTTALDYRPVDGSPAYTFGHVGGVAGGAQTYAGAYSSATANDIGAIVSSSSNVTSASARTLYVLRRSLTRRS